MIDVALYISYILIALAILGSFVLPLIKSADDPASLVKGGIGVVALIVLFGIGYALSSDEVTATYTEFGVDAGLSKIIGASMITMYLIGLIAVIAIVFTEFAKFFK